MTNDNDTLFTRQMNAIQHNAYGKKKILVKDSVIAQVMESATAGMAVGATAGMAVGTSAAYAAEHLHKDAENNPVSPEEQTQQNEPTVEERLVELEEKESANNRNKNANALSKNVNNAKYNANSKKMNANAEKKTKKRYGARVGKASKLNIKSTFH